MYATLYLELLQYERTKKIIIINHYIAMLAGMSYTFYKFCLPDFYIEHDTCT